jgi:hypothetical protein
LHDGTSGTGASGTIPLWPNVPPMPGYFFEFTATDPVNGLSTEVKVPVTLDPCYQQ